MRTKSLLGLAALAASALAVQAATPVYSLNIVGYANVPVPAGRNSLLSNPFDLDGTNSAANVLTLSPLNDNYAQPAGTLNSFTLLIWTGFSFDSTYFESDFTSNVYGPNSGNASGPTTGWATDSGGGTAKAPPVIPPGVGFFIQNGGNAGTNVFVGNVKPGPGQTNSISIPAGRNSLVGSMLPVGGQLPSDGNYTGLAGPISSLQFPLSPLNDNYAQPAGSLNSVTLLKWTGFSFDSTYYESDFTSNVYGPNSGNASGPTNGWATDSGGGTRKAAPSFGVGEAFFIQNGGNAGTWSQGLTNGF